MASGYKNAADTDFDDLFDPDIVGDGPTAAIFEDPDGTLLKYANVKYGTAGSNVGFKLSNNADVATIWAKKGSASYATPDNGKTYTSRVIVPNGGSRSAGIEMYLSSLNPLQYTVGPDGSASQPVPQTFDVPAGMAYFRTTLTLSSGTAADLVTQHTAWTAMNTLNQTLAEIVSAVYAYASGSHNGTYTCTLEFSPDGVQSVYSGSTEWVWFVDGSVA